MSMDVNCKVCGRKIVNLTTSHLCEDGTYVGPICKGKLKEGVPSFESLLLTQEEAKEIDVKILLASSGDIPYKEKAIEREKQWKDFRNIPWDPYSGPVLESPAHPNAISSINLQELLKFKKLLRNGEDGSKFGYEEITKDHIARAVHCFLKLFKDPNLNKDQLELYNKKLGLKLLGVAPSEINDDKHSDFSNFVITSTTSAYPERALMIKVSSSGWVNFRCLNLVGNNVESSLLSDLVMVVPRAARRNNGCSNFQLISAFVVSVFVLDDPSESEALKKVFPFWNDFNSISGDKAFNFVVPENSGDSEEE